MINLKLANFSDNYDEETSTIKFHIVNPNIQIITPSEEDENQKLITFNIYDYDDEKTICTYDVRFNLIKKRLTSTYLTCNLDYHENTLSLKQNSRFENNGMNFHLSELKYFVSSLKKNIDSTFTLFITEGNIMLVVTFNSQENTLSFENMIMSKTKHFESCEVQLELSLLNPLVKNNIIDQFDNLYRRLYEIEILMAKKKII